MFRPELLITPSIDALIDLALAEDLGLGDATSDAVVPPTATATAELQAREALVVCGRPIVDRLFERWGSRAPSLEWLVGEGQTTARDTVVATLQGRLRDVLALERTVLNFVQRMSGVATQTQRYVAAVAGTRARIVDTRKTLPGWRALDKYAVRIGGAHNHRAALDGGILIKDNHLRAAGGIAAAVASARRNASHALRVEVEVEDLLGLEAALSAGAEVVLIDNFTPELAREAVSLAAGRALIEASGGINESTVRAFAEAGVDLISVGALTHSVRAADLALEVRLDC